MKKEQLQQIVDRQNEIIANLQAIEKEHQKTNGELIVENKQYLAIIEKALAELEEIKNNGMINSYYYKILQKTLKGELK